MISTKSCKILMRLLSHVAIPCWTCWWKTLDKIKLVQSEGCLWNRFIKWPHIWTRIPHVTMVLLTGASYQEMPTTLPASLDLRDGRVTDIHWVLRQGLTTDGVDDALWITNLYCMIHHTYLSQVFFLDSLDTLKARKEHLFRTKSFKCNLPSRNAKWSQP